MARYVLSRTLMAAFIFLALRASLWAAVDHSSLTPVLLWMVAAGASYLICTQSPEVAHENI